MKRIEETSFILSKVIEEIKSKLPSRIESIYISKNRMLNIKTENFNVRINCDPGNPLMFLSEKLNEKAKNNFNDALSSYAKSLRITGIEQIKNDRVAKITLTKETSLIIELIPGRFNILILENNVIKNLYSYKKDKEGALKIKIGDEYSFERRGGSFMDSLSSVEKELAGENSMKEIDIRSADKFYLYGDDKKYYVLFKQKNNLEEQKSSSSPSELIEYAFEESVREDKERAESSRTDLIEAKMAKLKRILDEMKDDESLEDEAEEMKERAETLKANIYRADKETEFESVYDESKKIRIIIPKGVSVSEYLKVIFDEYKKVKNSIEKNKTVRKEIINEIEKLKKRLSEVLSMEKETEEKEDRVPGRVFTSPNGFKVISGRSASENDELTMKTAKKDDIFFHAREAKGSHVILKTAGKIPAKEDILFAASIAAYHSAGKHSKLVSVSYIEKRFVVKRKNSPKGEVVMLKEKTLFVRPMSGRE